MGNTNWSLWFIKTNKKVYGLEGWVWEELGEKWGRIWSKYIYEIIKKLRNKTNNKNYHPDCRLPFNSYYEQ